MLFHQYVSVKTATLHSSIHSPIPNHGQVERLSARLQRVSFKLPPNSPANPPPVIRQSPASPRHPLALPPSRPTTHPRFHAPHLAPLHPPAQSFVHALRPNPIRQPGKPSAVSLRSLGALSSGTYRVARLSLERMLRGCRADVLRIGGESRARGIAQSTDSGNRGEPGVQTGFSPGSSGPPGDAARPLSCPHPGRRPPTPTPFAP